jgi:ubiquinone/menaquinone biosynthesis C-methylase UbiE
MASFSYFIVFRPTSSGFLSDGQTMGRYRLKMTGYKMNPKGRFSDRVDDYVKYRPGYPTEMIEFLTAKIGLRPGLVVADIGSGTGISTQVFLKNGQRVYAVEPNKAMREAAEKALSEWDSFTSVEGSSEQTHVPSQCCDLINVAQAFHWMEPVATKREFRRILKDGGWISLIWNERQVGESAFSLAYEQIIGKYAIDYEQVKHQNVDELKIRSFLGPTMVKTVFNNAQELNLEQLVGRLVSASYMPGRDHASFEAMIADIEEIFNREAINGIVKINYMTQIFLAYW